MSTTPTIGILQAHETLVGAYREEVARLTAERDHAFQEIEKARKIAALEDAFEMPAPQGNRLSDKDAELIRTLRAERDEARGQVRRRDSVITQVHGHLTRAVGPLEDDGDLDKALRLIHAAVHLLEDGPVGDDL